MATDIPRQLRVIVIKRAKRLCEYCQKPDDRELNFYCHEVDHIIAEKHGGQTVSDNLAYACLQCNRHKGTDIASLDPQSGLLTPLFNPRIQQWSEHFQLHEDGTITALTAVERTTTALLNLNDPIRIQVRAALIVAGKLGSHPQESHGC